MIPFIYQRAADPAQAVHLASNARTRFLGGGTNLVDLMRHDIESPAGLVDVTALPADIVEMENGAIRIGAAARNTAVAEHLSIRRRYPMLSRAILAGASAQIRNMATVGGNILQRTRCPYFYDVAGSACNKRNPGEGCDAIGGFNRYHAILGTSSSCIATHPSDMCVALVALDADVHLRGPRGSRLLKFSRLHRLPDDTPHRDTILQPGELIEAIEIPPLDFAAHSIYRKVRDRSSYAFALVSVAATLEMNDGVVTDLRLALGGVGTRPWRALAAEDALRSRQATAENFLAAAHAELAPARPSADNAFKVDLAARTIVAVLTELSERHS